ncbi:hypothetical protein ACFV4X_36025 [Streptomyces ardesiacus]|uniref:hypothetical protein n=1 Tax=Streptomyces ardesiacus TaxID=285564 RepID=UPI00365D5BE1
MDLFPVWKRYVRAVDQEFERAGFPGASHSVSRDKDHPGVCVATWSWPVGTPLLDAHEWPSGLTITWSSLYRRWTYSLPDEHGENILSLPVAALAAPCAVSAVLPALMDGRHHQMPTSEERWEHAGLLESWAQSAAMLGDDKYDAAYEAAEEEAASFLRWQEELDGTEAAAQQGVGLAAEGGERAGLIRYRIVAQLTDPEHPGAVRLTNYAYGRSVEEALVTVRMALEKPGGLHGDQGLYRVVEVVEESPDSEVGRQEEARRRYLTSEGRPSREAEGGEAPADLVERVLEICGRHYAAVTGTSSDLWDKETARDVVGLALRTVRMAERDAYPQALDTYLRERRARLERLWQRYGPDGMFAGEVVLIDLPGCFALCERIDNSPLWLEGLWSQEGEEETALERLRDSWLYDTSEKDGR